MKRSYGTLTGNTTITVSLSNDQDLELLLTQDGTGSRLVTWSGVTTWLTPSGSAPVLKTAAGGKDLILLSKAAGSVYGIHTAETGATGSAGSTGPAGITWKGTYSSATTYAINDAVYYNGSSYIALQASSSTNAQQPDLAPTYWSGLASAAAATSGESVDNFTRADNASISTNAPFSYTSIGTGTAQIVSNSCRDTDTTDANTEYRAEVPLISADHHCKVTLGTFTASGTTDVEFGALCRCDASAHTAYMAVALPQTGPVWRFRLYKIVAGVYTQIYDTGLTGAPVAGDNITLSVAGTQIVGSYNGVQLAVVTDSAITTGVRAGFHLVRASAGVDVRLSELRFGV